MSFTHNLAEICRKQNSLVCVGLDPDPLKIPNDIDVLTFCTEIIKATSPYACAFKPNLAFFEALGVEGFSVLKEVLKAVPSDLITIADAKRADIGNTASAYAKSIFDELGFDAVTLNPYMGHDSIEPFTRYDNKGLFILCRTSNTGATDFQQLRLSDGRYLYEAVATKVNEWNTDKNMGLVVGATAPSELSIIRAMCPDLPFLIPGVGAQGASVAQTVSNAINKEGLGVIINSSRQIIYASNGADYASAAALTAKSLRDEINSYR